MTYFKCWLFGHDWTILAWSFKYIALNCCSPLAGCCVKCERCGDRECDIAADLVDENGKKHECDLN